MWTPTCDGALQMFKAEHKQNARVASDLSATKLVSPVLFSTLAVPSAAVSVIT